MSLIPKYLTKDIERKRLLTAGVALLFCGFVVC